MVGRAENVTAEGLVAAGAVGPRGRIAARAVETAEVSRARGCGAVGATKAVRLAKAGCRAVGATKVARLAKAGYRQKSRDWPKPGAAVQRGRQKLRGGPKPGAAGQRGRAAVAGSVHITRMCRRCGCVGPPRWLRRWSVSGLPGRRGAPHTPVGSGSCPQSQRGWWVDLRSRLCSFFCRGRSSRSRSAVVESRACWSAVFFASWSAEVLAFAIPSSTSRRETDFSLACIPGSRLSQKGAR